MSTNSTSDVPPEVYDTYNLLFNNVTYRAVRKALEEAASYGSLNADQPNVAFIDEIMALLIDASFERCGAERYQGAEADLMRRLRPLDSHLSGLAQRHLSNFGPSPDHAVRPSSELLQITRAELHALRHEMQQDAAANAHIAAHWLQAAALLTGAAGELIHELDYPITANRHAARATLLAAFEALEQGIAASMSAAYPLPDDLDDVLRRILSRLALSPSE